MFRVINRLIRNTNISAILTDTFNTYNDGDLNSQGSWSGDTAFDVEGTTVYEGAKAVSVVNPAGDYVIYKAGTQLAAGVQGVHVKISASVLNAMNFAISEGETTYAAGIRTDAAGNFERLSDGGWADLAAFTVDTWYFIQIEWRSSPDHKVRFRIDAGAWSDWYTPFSDWTTGEDRVYLYCQAGTFSTYYDWLTETSVQNLTLTCDLGEFTLTGIDAILGKGYTLVCNVGNFILTGINNIFSGHWYTFKDKNTAEYTNQTKNTTTFTNQTKNTSNYTYKDKS